MAARPFVAAVAAAGVCVTAQAPPPADAVAIGAGKIVAIGSKQAIAPF